MDAEAHELIAAFAIDALDEADRARAKELLATSAEARAQLRAFSEVSAALAVATVGPPPPAGLRERILSEARAEGQVVVPFERPGAGRRNVTRMLGAVAAVAAVVAVGLGVWGLDVAGELDDTRAALDRAQAVTTVLGDPSAQTVSLAAGSGKLVVGSDGAAVLVVDGLDEAPAGKTYQVWIVTGDEAASAGTFTGGTRRDVILVGGAVAPDQVVAVTVEDAPGTTAPTSTPIVATRPV